MTRHHQTRPGLPDPTVEGWVTVDALRLATLHLVGHSLGGLIAVAYAAAHPARVASLTIVDSPLRISPATADCLARLNRFPRIHYRTLACPICLIRGADSTVVSHTALARLAALVPAARVAEIPSAHHHVMLDHPEHFGRTLQSFLGRCPSAAASRP